MKHDVVVAGWAQVTQPKAADKPKDPMGLMAQAARQAAKNLKISDGLSLLDGILVVKSLSAHYEAPEKQLSSLVGASPKVSFQSKIGGNSPQTMINMAAGRIARNELNMVLVAGAEAYVPRSGSEVKPASALLQGIPEGYAGDDAIGATPFENQYGIEHPMQGFPLFETALWAASNMGIKAYLKKVATLWSEFSQTAAGHPYAWTRQSRTPEEILQQSPSNRPIAFPYTKFMNSFVTVDQGAAVILMSADFAKEHGPRQGKTVYFCGGGYAEDRQRFMVEKSDFTSSPPLKAAVDKALNRAGMTLEEMDCFDLYSCFPCAVSIAKKMMGIQDNDHRALTLTGGLGFFGGPGNNYNLHAVVTLCDMIARGEKTTGLVTALGWFMHKHAAGIYSSQQPKKSLAAMDIEDQTDFLAGPEPVELDQNPSGTGIIETYTIVYNRDRSPAYAVLYGRTQKGLRFLAKTPANLETFQSLSTKNMVGKTVSLEQDPKQNLTIAIF